MRSSVLFTAAFAAAALAGPVFDKRGEIVVTDNEVVYVTQVVTVTEGQVAPAASTPAAGYGKPGWWKGRGRKGRKSRKPTGYAPAPTNPAPVPSSEASAPAPAPSTYEPAPQPEPSTEAPAPAPTSYEQPAPAPTSYEQPAPAPTSQAPAPPAYTPAPSPGGSYKDQVLYHHNVHRANHSAPDLVWSDELAAIAQQIASTCVYEHDTSTGGGGYGQNIAAGPSGDKIGGVISDLFYNGELEFFDGQYGKAEPDMTNFMKYGHMTQVVWKSTTEVACATQNCTLSGLAKTGESVGKFFTVCNYREAGNMRGAFDKNVGECLGQPTVRG